MFGANSRYLKTPIVDVTTATGTTVRAVALRRLPQVDGAPTEMAGTDRLDLMAERHYGDGTRFWRIADANTELEARRLVAHEPPENPLVADEPRLVNVPED